MSSIAIIFMYIFFINLNIVLVSILLLYVYLDSFVFFQAFLENFVIISVVALEFRNYIVPVKASFRPDPDICLFFKS